MIIGLAFFVLGILLLVALSIMVRSGRRPSLRTLRAFSTLNTHVGQAVESGGRVHVSIGPNSIIGSDALTALAGLAMLERVTAISSISDLAPVATTGDASAWLILGDTMLRVYRRRDLTDRYELTSGRLVALDSIGLAGGLTSVVADDVVRTNILIGSFGPEVALAAEPAGRNRTPQIIGSDRLETQAVAYAMADHALIGEEIFASRGYLDQTNAGYAALMTQDVLRWVVVGAIIIGAIMASLGLVG